MEKHYALIKKSLVIAVVVGNDSFLSHIEGKYDYVIDVTNRERPSAGDSYYHEIDSFLNNEVEEVYVPVDKTAPHLNQGTEDGFEPFNLSQYSVRYDNGWVQIGCKKYSAAGLFDALHSIVVKNTSTIHVFHTTHGPAHGKYGISWNDVTLLYEKLKKVKL